MRKYLFFITSFLLPILIFAQDQQIVLDGLRGTIWKSDDSNIYWGFSRDNSSVYIFSNKDDVLGSLMAKKSWSIADNGTLIFGGLEPRDFEYDPQTSFELIWTDDNQLKFDYIGLFSNDPTALTTPNPVAGKSTSIDSDDFQGVITPYIVEKGEPGIMVTFHASVPNPRIGTTSFSLWIRKNNNLIETNQVGYNINGKLAVCENITFSFSDIRHDFRNRNLFIPYYVMKNVGLSGWQDFEVFLRAYNSNKGELLHTSWMPIRVYIP